MQNRKRIGLRNNALQHNAKFQINIPKRLKNILEQNFRAKKLRLHLLKLAKNCVLSLVSKIDYRIPLKELNNSFSVKWTNCQFYNIVVLLQIDRNSLKDFLIENQHDIIYLSYN